MKIRTLIVAGLVAGSMTITGAAFATPGGSTESTDDPETEVNESNQVTCGSEDDVNGIDVSANASGIEVCSDDAEDPIQGRVILSSERYASIDGDADNAEKDPALAGYARLDEDGPSCGNTEGGDTDSTVDNNAAPMANCG